MPSFFFFFSPFKEIAVYEKHWISRVRARALLVDDMVIDILRFLPKCPGDVVSDLPEKAAISQCACHRPSCRYIRPP